MRRFLRRILAFLLAACGGGSRGGDTTPDAGLAEVLFYAHPPDTTPAGDAIYMMGDFQGWNPASAAHRFTRVDDYSHALTLSFPVGTHLEFKLTRGSLATVEKDNHGDDRPNRVYDVTGPAEVNLGIGAWADLLPSTVVGDVTKTTVPGFLAGRRVWVYLPPGYHEGTARYPVLYMLDGQNVFDRLTSFAGEWRVDETLQAGIPAGQVAPLIVVAVDNGGGARIEEYTPWGDSGEGGGGGGGAHLAAITDVLVPWVDATYRTLTGPTHRGIGGSSLGGLMALYATYARPDVFGVNAALSPSIWWAGGRIVTFASSSATRPAARVWMDMGTGESGSAIADLRRMRDAMVAQGFVLDQDLKVFEDPDGAHSESSWSQRFPNVVRFLFPP